MSQYLQTHIRHFFLQQIFKRETIKGRKLFAEIWYVIRRAVHLSLYYLSRTFDHPWVPLTSEFLDRFNKRNWLSFFGYKIGFRKLQEMTISTISSQKCSATTNTTTGKKLRDQKCQYLTFKVNNYPNLSDFSLKNIVLGRRFFVIDILLKLQFLNHLIS